MAWWTSLIGSALNNNSGYGGGQGGTGLSLASEDTYTDKKYAIAQNLFDPGGKTGFWESKKKKKEQGPTIFDLLMDYFKQRYNDPYYKDTQKTLSDYGTNVLKGDVPEYYKPIGDFDNPYSQDIIDMGARDISRNVNESLARRGIRSPRGTNLIASQVSDLGKQVRWDDYVRAMTGRQFLLGTGLNTLTGVRQAALGKEVDMGNYMLNAARTGLSEQGLIHDIGTGQAGMTSNSISGMSGAIGSIMGMFGDNKNNGTVAPVRGSATGVTGSGYGYQGLVTV
jgi:hypothetical protein